MLYTRSVTIPASGLGRLTLSSLAQHLSLLLQNKSVIIRHRLPQNTKTLFVFCWKNCWLKDLFPRSQHMSPGANLQFTYTHKVRLDQWLLLFLFQFPFGDGGWRLACVWCHLVSKLSSGLIHSNLPRVTMSIPRHLSQPIRARYQGLVTNQRPLYTVLPAGDWSADYSPGHNGMVYVALFIPALN